MTMFRKYYVNRREVLVMDYLYMFTGVIMGYYPLGARVKSGVCKRK